MEEVFLLILGGNKAEAAIGDDLLNGTGGHVDLQHFPNSNSKRTVRSEVGDHAEQLLEATNPRVAQTFEPDAGTRPTRSCRGHNNERLSVRSPNAPSVMLRVRWRATVC